MSYFNCQSEHTARKPHCCDFCSTAIEKGERYSRTVHNHEGDFICWKEHLDCRAAGTAWMRLTGEDFYYPLASMEDEDRDWLKEEFPTIFERRSRINPIVEAL